MDALRLVKTDAEIQLPPELAICPICGAKVVIEDITGWTQADDGSWIADEVSINCDTEPELGSEEWDDWYDWHWNMPYVDWLPLRMNVEKWLAANYRFDVGANP